MEADAWVASCDPVDPATLTGGGIEEALQLLGASIRARPRRALRRRCARVTRARLVFALAALAVAAGGSVAVGAVLSAHTGRFVPKSQVPMGGPGELLDPAAPNFHTVALQVGADIPFPSGYGAWRDLVVSDASDPSGLVSTGALHGWFAMSAFCAWVRNWRQAVVAGDASAAAQAAETIAQAPGWKAVTDEDPHPDPSAANDPGAEAGTLFGWFLPYRDAVLAGDRGRVDHLLASGYGDGKCWVGDPGWRALLASHRDWRTLSPGALARKYEQFLAGQSP